MSPTEQIRKALKESLITADAANNAASTLANLILEYHPRLISGVSIVRETATLLQHVTQNFNRSASTELWPTPNRNRRR